MHTGSMVLLEHYKKLFLSSLNTIGTVNENTLFKQMILYYT